MIRAMPSTSVDPRAPDGGGAPGAPGRHRRTTAQAVEDRRGPGLATSALRVLAGLAVLLAVGALVFFAAAALEGDEDAARAPWSSSSAPSVTPAPLADQ